jgi:hypothetical protein
MWDFTQGAARAHDMCDATACRACALRKPMAVSNEVWQRAIDDAGRFLDDWAGLAVEFDSTAGDLFDVPRDGKFGGLVWGLKEAAAIEKEHGGNVEVVLVGWLPSDFPSTAVMNEAK